jgi:hypothetical protein
MSDELDTRSTVENTVLHVPQDAKGLLIVKVPAGTNIDSMHGFAQVLGNLLKEADIKCKIMLVEDNVSFQFLTDETLADLGFVRTDEPYYLAITKDIA